MFSLYLNLTSFIVFLDISVCGSSLEFFYGNDVFCSEKQFEFLFDKNCYSKIEIEWIYS